ncbi:MAG: helix-turn-helix domain-containing protein, partial [Paludibacteraceae bacterium]|nr:helix-turn-helix domain-containing protein [Paludibacteraceae bacterium]
AGQADYHPLLHRGDRALYRPLAVLLGEAVVRRHMDLLYRQPQRLSYLLYVPACAHAHQAQRGDVPSLPARSADSRLVSARRAFPNTLWGGNLLLFARICFAIEVIWVWWRGYRVLRETRARLDDIYSDDRSYLLHPTYLIQHLLGITAAFSMCLNLLGRDFFAESMMVSIPAIIMSALLFGIGYVAAHTTLPQETIHTEAPQAKETTIEETDALMQAITTVLREQKLFASPDLTIHDLASAVHSNRTYVSQCINRRTGLSFSQYVARYRVEHAQQILRDSGYGTDKEAIMDAVTSSGFSSDQTFYRVFKEITGETPLQYRHKNLQ